MAGIDFAAIWAEMEDWFVTEWNAFSKAELALLKSEIPIITSAGAKALEDFVIQEASSLEAQVVNGLPLLGSMKAAILGQTISSALNRGLQVIGGQSVKADQPLSTTLLNTLVEAGAASAKIGVAALIAGA